MIAIVNYGSGNIQAICNIYKRLGIKHIVCSTPDEVWNGEKIVLPGVGAFDQAMGELERSGLRAVLEECVIKERRPILGICVGMQLMANGSEEGELQGLGWIEGTVRKFRFSECASAPRLPQIGWNTIEAMRESSLLKDVNMDNGFYFLHSYYYSCKYPSDILAKANYGGDYVCAVNRENIYGVQFHPEKSHGAGVQLLKNFAERVDGPIGRKG